MSSTNDPINGKIVIITGASSGLGESTARRLADRGAKLALAARREDRLKSLADELVAGHRCHRSRAGGKPGCLDQEKIWPY